MVTSASAFVKVFDKVKYLCYYQRFLFETLNSYLLSKSTPGETLPITDLNFDRIMPLLVL